MLRLYLDEDSMGSRVAAALTRAGFDVLTAGAAGNYGIDDEAQLRFCVEAQRVIVTANKRDFPRIHREWLKAGRAHAGIIVRTRQSLGIGQQVGAIEAMSAVYGVEGMAGQLEYMTQWLPRE